MPIDPQPGIMSIAAYVPGASKLSGTNSVTKLSSNENPAGPSAQAIAAFRAASDTLGVYPSSDHAELRAAIGRVEGLEPERIICGAGSDEVIAMLCNAYAGPGTEVIHTEHGFAMYEISARAAGATPIEVPERERTADVDAILAAITDATRLIFIANPNNPTGTMILGEDLARLAAGVPETCLLVIDGAYAEYVPGYDGGAGLVTADGNVVMTRTFSKIHGLGSLRVGWGYGPVHVIDALNRIRGPFNVSAAGLAAAEAAILDTEYTRACRDANARWRDWLAGALDSIGIPSDPSYGNFILARFTSAAMVEVADAHLKQNGFLVRKVGGYKLPEALRITIGDEIACRRVASLLGEVMKRSST